MSLSKGVYSGQDVFEVKVTDNHGAEVSKFITFDASATVTAPTTAGGQPTVTTSVSTQPAVSLAQPVIAAVIAPTNAVTIDLDATSDSGVKDTDNITKDTTPTLTGSTDIPFSKVEIMDGTTVVATTTSDANGAYQVSTSALGDATHTLSAHATDPSATTDVVSPNLDVVVDTTINAKPDSATVTEDATVAVTGSVMINDDNANGETVAATSVLKTAHGAYTLSADGTYTFTVDNAASQSLAQGKSATDTLTYDITDTAGNTTTATLTTTITGSNDAPVVTATTGTPADLGITNEDTAKTFTQAEILHLIGASDVDTKDTLSISVIHMDAKFGTFTKSGTNWVLHPAHDISGTDIKISVDVTDGHSTTKATASVSINAVADGAISSMVESVSTDFANPTITEHGGTWERRNPTVWGWKTDNADGTVEHGVGSAYGDTSGGNIGVVELEGGGW